MADENTTDEKISTEEEQEDLNLAEIVRDQSEALKTLVDEITSNDTTGATQQPIYFNTPEKGGAKTPNYVMYILIGVGIWFFFLRKG